MGLLGFNLTPTVMGVAGGLITASIIGAFKYALKLRPKKILEQDRYTPAGVKSDILDDRAPYVRPDCQDNNPASPVSAVNRRPIFQEVDQLLGPPLVGRFTLILADSGMGKTTFLQKYYARHWREYKRRRRFKAVLIPLSQPSADELINRVEAQARSETVLLLDALDEDNAAIDDFAKRFNELVKLAGKFRAVLIACRTQFLTDVAGVPEEIDLPAPPGPMGLSDGPDRKVRRIYLSPFSDEQVERYLAARFPRRRHRALRMRVERTACRFKDLMSRPLLLAHIEDIASESEELKYSFQVYSAIVASWLRREVRKKQLNVPAGRPRGILRGVRVKSFYEYPRSYAWHRTAIIS